MPEPICDICLEEFEDGARPEARAAIEWLAARDEQPRLPLVLS